MVDPKRAPRRSALACIVLALVTAASAFAKDDGKKERTWDEPFARGFGYLGAFWVGRTNTEVRLFSNDLPLGARLNLSRDLDVEDSFTVPRGQVGWRFGKRHILSAGFFDLSRDGLKRLEREIELPGTDPIEIGAEIETTFDTEIGRLQYTYLFHLDERVKLGIGAGLFIAKLGIGFSIAANVDEVEERVTVFDESVTAPLPVFGFRLTYRITPRWGVLAMTDWFLLNYNDEYKGVFTDTQVFAAHRTWKHVGFAGGINFQTFNVEILDDDLEWQVDAGLVGLLGVVTFYF